jgi:hypothetical protein
VIAITECLKGFGWNARNLTTSRLFLLKT